MPEPTSESTSQQYLYRFNNYWRRWARVLSKYHQPARGCVEVNLTPINPTEPLAWSFQVEPIIIRVHTTPPDNLDIFHKEKIPYGVRALMVFRLGEQLTDRLLHEDFLSQIDWVKYRVASAGNVSLASVLKG